MSFQNALLVSDFGKSQICYNDIVYVSIWDFVLYTRHFNVFDESISLCIATLAN